MSAFEADRFNHSRTSPRYNSYQPSAFSQKHIPRCLTKQTRVRLLLTTNHCRLTTTPKERLQQLRAASRQNSALNLDLMIQLRMIQDLHHRPHRAGLRIVGAIDEPLDAGMHHRTGAHSARLNCNKQIAVSQAVVTNGCTRLAQRNNLSVRGWVGVRDIAIPSPANDAAPMHDHRSDGNFAGFERALSAAQSLFHPEFVGEYAVAGH